jgi:hypothetical protein
MTSAAASIATGVVAVRGRFVTGGSSHPPDGLSAAGRLGFDASAVLEVDSMIWEVFVECGMRRKQ